MPESPTDLPRGYQFPQNTERADPSALTVAMLERAVAQLREHYDGELRSLKEGLKTAHEDYVRVPTLLDRAISVTKELFEVKIRDAKELIEAKIQAAADVRQEQFHALDLQLQGRAERSKDLDAARESALNHALAAAKELVAASNTNFTKQIDGLQLSFGSQIRALDEKVNDLRERLTQFSSVTQGGAEAQIRRRAETGSNSAIVSALIAALGFAVVIGTIMFTRVPAPTYYAPPQPVTNAPAR